VAQSLCTIPFPFKRCFCLFFAVESRSVACVHRITTNHRFNMNAMIVQNILESSYMKSLVYVGESACLHCYLNCTAHHVLLCSESTYQDLIDAIFHHVTHVGTCARLAPPPHVRASHGHCGSEPWATGTARTPSTAWCVLYRFLCMRLTRNQMKSMLNNKVRERACRCAATCAITRVVV